MVEASDGRGSEEKVEAKEGKGEVRGGAKGMRLHDEAATGMLGGWRKAEAAAMPGRRTRKLESAGTLVRVTGPLLVAREAGRQKEKEMGIERGGGGIERWRRWREDEGEMGIGQGRGLGLDRAPAGLRMGLGGWA